MSAPEKRQGRLSSSEGGRDTASATSRHLTARTKRTLTTVLVIMVVCVGLAVHTGVGTPSSWGILDVAALCPLGTIEVAVAAKTVIPPLFLGLGIAVVLIALTGRSFCGWGCPVPLLRRVLGVRSAAERREATARRERRRALRRKRREAASGEVSFAAAEAPDERQLEEAEREVSFSSDAAAGEASYAAGVATSYQGQEAASGPLGIAASRRGGLADARNWVLGGAVLSSAVMGFPVFCLVCPVGLTFASVIAIWKTFQLGTFTLSFAVFPVMLVLEVTLLRRWCHHLCPLGALMSLVGRLNRTLRPTVDAQACIKDAKGVACDRCAHVCPEGIDLHDAVASAPLRECTRCKTCQGVCPGHAISFPLIPVGGGRKASSKDERS